MDYKDIERMIESKIATTLENILLNWNEVTGYSVQDLYDTIQSEIYVLRS